ncbi:CDP-paratose 2-epimerase [Methanomicrobium sp. W14]|uniref:NAD-dependent epimerase/dehydratase family protein n=1 Tax=Methanomicrobium sp. W14 TaxID=2817839 RepID=UPI001AE514D9|nr:NAD-dependent epimerase/dehydratase family protein [Methanomicrobium sp. W14]MBP2134444.1 CDP-paratose 2-epimerase [Methanomicrobium sp. W14]
MKILVTGGCGFLGSHICEMYKEQHEEVVSFDNLTKKELLRTGYKVNDARNYNLQYLKTIGVSVIKGDISKSQQLEEAVKECDYIIHTAAQPAMTVSIENPRLDFDTNVLGTFNVLEAARKYDIPVACCSSIHVYGNGINNSLVEGDKRFTRVPTVIDENYPILQGCLTPLHASKRADEIYSQTYIDTYGLKAAIFRLSGMYGPRQFGGEDHGWVANFAIRTAIGLPIKIFGTDKQVRDILYAKDAALAFDAFYQHQSPGLYNIGGGESNMISLGECLQIINDLTGKKSLIEKYDARLGDLWYFASDISKAKKCLDWAPKVSNYEGLTKIVEWILKEKNLFAAN